MADEKITVSIDRYTDLLAKEADCEELKNDVRKTIGDIVTVLDKIGMGFVVDGSLEAADDKELRKMKRKVLAKVASIVSGMMLGDESLAKLVPENLLGDLKKLVIKIGQQ